MRFDLTEEQMKMICDIYGRNLNDVEDYQVSEMLDGLIEDCYINVMWEENEDD